MSPSDYDFQKPRSLEYPEHFRPGLGTENVAPFLRSLIQMTRPNRVLEIGAGYTTPFILEALVNNQRVFNDGNLDLSYLTNLEYDPKFVIIDDFSLEELNKKDEMRHILNSDYVEFVEGRFEGRSESLFRKYGTFDFVWFDCGGVTEYQTFFREYWEICSSYVICHFTYSDGKPNDLYEAVINGSTGDPFQIDIIEPHKTRQGSITILKKRN